MANHPARMEVPAVLPVVGRYVDNPAMTIVMRWGSRNNIPNQIAKRLWKEAWCVGCCDKMSGFLVLNVLAYRMSKLLKGECVLNITAWKLCHFKHPDC